MTNYAVLKFDKIHTYNEFYGKYKHNYRLGDVQNADKERSYLNREIIKLQSPNYTEAYKKRINELDFYKTRKIRCDAVKGIDVMMTFSNNKTPEDSDADKSKNAYEVKMYFEDNNDFDLEQWIDLNRKWLIDTFGEKNVISAVLHMDETTPHIHAVVIPVTENEHLSAKEVIGGPSNVKTLQDEYAKCMSPVGLERGVRRSVAKAKDIREFYGALDKAMEPKLPIPHKTESKDEYYHRASQFYTKEAVSQLKHNLRMEREIDVLKSEHKNDQIELRNLLKQLEDYTRQQKKIQFYDSLRYALQIHPDKAFTKLLEKSLQEVLSFAKERDKEKNEPMR